jgi:hypothetical protein
LCFQPVRGYEDDPHVARDIILLRVHS